VAFTGSAMTPVSSALGRLESGSLPLPGGISIRGSAIAFAFARGIYPSFLLDPACAFPSFSFPLDRWPTWGTMVSGLWIIFRGRSRRWSGGLPSGFRFPVEMSSLDGGDLPPQLRFIALVLNSPRTIFGEHRIDVSRWGRLPRLTSWFYRPFMALGMLFICRSRANRRFGP